MSRPKIRMRFSAMAIVLALGAGSIATLGGCDLIMTPTKVANGQLYQSGEGKYDPYFASVHQEQLAAANWPDESKAARKPIITALNLRPGASNSTILSATREKKGDAALGSAVDQTTAAELELARKLNAAASKLDDMQKHGEELRKQAAEDKKNLGADKADEKKVAKKDEVKREIAAAVDAVESMATDARRGAKEAEELAAKLKSAWTGKDEGPATKPDDKKPDDKKPDDDKKDEKKKPEPVAKKTTPAAAKKPAAKPDAPEKPPEDKPEKPAKPAPTQKPPDEVFNP